MPILPVAKLGKSTIKARETRLTKRKIKPLIRNNLLYTFFCYGRNY